MKHKVKHLHFVGIGGSGMNGIAKNIDQAIHVETLALGAKVIIEVGLRFTAKEYFIGHDGLCVLATGKAIHTQHITVAFLHCQHFQFRVALEIAFGEFAV